MLIQTTELGKILLEARIEAAQKELELAELELKQNGQPGDIDNPNSLAFTIQDTAVGYSEMLIKLQQTAANLKEIEVTTGPIERIGLGMLVVLRGEDGAPFFEKYFITGLNDIKNIYDIKSIGPKTMYGEPNRFGEAIRDLEVPKTIPKEGIEIPGFPLERIVEVGWGEPVGLLQVELTKLYTGLMNQKEALARGRVDPESDKDLGKKYSDYMGWEYKMIKYITEKKKNVSLAYSKVKNEYPLLSDYIKAGRTERIEMRMAMPAEYTHLLRMYALLERFRKDMNQL